MRITRLLLFAAALCGCGNIAITPTNFDLGGLRPQCVSDAGGDRDLGIACEGEPCGRDGQGPTCAQGYSCNCPPKGALPGSYDCTAVPGLGRRGVCEQP